MVAQRYRRERRFGGRGTAASLSMLVLVCLGYHLIERGAEAAEDPHAYFNALIKRTDHWKSYSFRDQAQLGSSRWATYDPSSDTDRHRQDAAKIIVPAFLPSTQLTKAISTTDTILELETAKKPSFPRNRVIQVDREVMTVTAWLSDTSISVTRATHGSTPASHASGATLMRATNSLPNQVRVPLGTEDGHDYFFVWDSYWTDSFVGAGAFNHKAFQFTSGGKDGDSIWLQPQVAYGKGPTSCWDPNRHVAAFSVRSMNSHGGGPDWSATNGNMLGPAAPKTATLGPRGDFCITPNTWTRFFLHIRQKANDYDVVDVWVSDETRDAVQVVMGAPVSVRPTGRTPNSIAKFWVEFNSSTDTLLRSDQRDLVAYVRNFVALRDVQNPQSLLARPAPGVPSAAAPPAAPRNLRIAQ